MWLRRILALVLIFSAPVLLAATLPPVEPMPTLDAATLASPAILNGIGYTVDSKAPVVGYMGQFTLRAPAGVFSANGTEMLAIRVSELAAIAQLSQLSQSGVFADALAASAVKKGSAIGQAVSNPAETLVGIPSGVGRFFESTTTAISRASESSTANSPSATDTANDLLGINEVKRRLAKQVGADPYTTNPVLAQQLDDLARAAFVGGVSVDVALAVSTAGVATAISATATVSDLVWERSPEDIRTVHERKLSAMGIDADTVRAFVTNRWLTPTLSVPLVQNLEALTAAKGRAAVVALASGVASEGEARFVVNAVNMARRIGTQRDPVVAIDVVVVDVDGQVLVVRTSAGRTEVPAPVDYAVWTEPVKAFAERKDVTGAERNILVTGLSSARAREGLQAAGWTVRDRSKP